jgi:predicted anti-sigma-YlaC factor YlaD
MTCQELEDRLYDEDARVALRGEGSPPADLAAHMARCPACRASWVEAGTQARRLAGVMIVAPPPPLRRALYASYRPPRRRFGRPWLDLYGLSWVVTCGAVGAGLAVTVAAPTPLSQWMGFGLGATCALVGTALPRTASLWRGPWELVRSVLAL